MIDTIVIKKVNPSSDELNSILDKLEVKFHYEEKGYCNARLRNLKIHISNNKTICVSGSLTEYYFGNNSFTLDFYSLRNTINSIESLLGISLEDALICRMDLSSNVITQHKPSAYFAYLISKPYFERFKKKTSLYFSTNSETVNIYDKRLKSSISLNENCLRYEHRLRTLTIIKSKLKIDKVNSLFCSEIYCRLVKYWYQSYQSIQKSDSNISIEAIHSEKSFKDFITFSGIEYYGGLTEVISLVNQLKLEDRIDGKVAYNIKKSLTETRQVSANKNSKLIKEINELFKQEYRNLMSLKN